MKKDVLQIKLIILVAALTVCLASVSDQISLVFYNDVSVEKVYIEKPENIITYDINTITFDQLVTIEGIGEVLAKRIVDYRLENGEIKIIEQLLEVEGIGDEKMKSISSVCYVK